LAKQHFIRSAQQKKFTLADDAFSTTPVVLSPCPRQLAWVCVAVEQHFDETCAVLDDVLWASWTASHEETAPSLWVSSLLAEFRENSPAAHWAF